MIKYILSIGAYSFSLYAGEYMGFGIQMGRYDVKELNSLLASKSLSISQNPIEYGMRLYYENGLVFGLSGFEWKSEAKNESLSLKAVGKMAIVEGGYPISLFKGIQTRIFLGAGSRDISLRFFPLAPDVSLDDLLDTPFRTSELSITNFTFSVAGEVIFSIFRHLNIDIKGGYFYSPYVMSRWELGDGAKLLNPPQINLSSPFISFGFTTDKILWGGPLLLVIFLTG